MYAVSGPATVEPMENPYQTKITRETLKRSGMYSAANANAFGVRPPKPKPVMNRQSISDCTSVAQAVIKLAAAKTTIEQNVYARHVGINENAVRKLELALKRLQGSEANMKNADFKLAASDISFTGENLSRPECVLAQADGTPT